MVVKQKIIKFLTNIYQWLLCLKLGDHQNKCSRSYKMVADGYDGHYGFFSTMTNRVFHLDDSWAWHKICYIHLIQLSIIHAHRGGTGGGMSPLRDLFPPLKNLKRSSGQTTPR